MKTMIILSLLINMPTIVYSANDADGDEETKERAQAALLKIIEERRAPNVVTIDPSAPPPQGKITPQERRKNEEEAKKSGNEAKSTACSAAASGLMQLSGGEKGEEAEGK